MGIGIIALGLWLLYGLDFRINEIQFIPPIISYIIVLIGIIISYKKTKKQGFKYALAFPLVNLVLCFFDIQNLYLSIFMAIALLYPLYIMFNTIYDIALEYPKDKKFKRTYYIWLVTQAIMLVLMLLGDNAPMMILYSLLAIELLYVVFVVYHLVKINKLISDEYEDISYHLPIYKKKHYVIMFILSALSICLLVLIEKPYLETTKEEVVLTENKYFKVDHEDFKIPPFGYTKETTTSLLSSGWAREFFGLKLYLKEELIENVHFAKYEIMYNNTVVCQIQGDTSLYENRNGDFYYVEYDIYDDYKEIVIDGKEDFKVDFLEAYSVNDSFKIYLELYDKNGECVYFNSSDVVPVNPTTYRYKDEWISIENLQYDFNGLVSRPKVRINDPEGKLTHVIIYYPHEGNGENVLLYLYNGWNQDGSFDLDTVRHFIYDKVEEFKYIYIEYRNGETIVDSRLCELEVVP